MFVLLIFKEGYFDSAKVFELEEIAKTYRDGMVDGNNCDESRKLSVYREWNQNDLIKMEQTKRVSEVHRAIFELTEVKHERTNNVY